MKKLVLFSLGMLMAAGAVAQSFTPTCIAKFSPNGGIEKEVTDRLDGAKNSVDLLAYNYTNDVIGAAVRRAKERGVVVRIIVDRKSPSETGAEIGLDKAAGVTTYVDASYRIAHSKVIVIDNLTVITGSYNWSGNAERVNSENILFCKSRAMAKIYNERFAYLITKAKPY